MFGFKIIKVSTWKEMSYAISMNDLDKRNLASRIEALTLKNELHKKSIGDYVETIHKLETEVKSLTRNRDAFGRYAKERIPNGK